MIWPVVFYNGTEKYDVAESLWGLFENQTLAKDIFINGFKLINLSEIPDKQIQKKLWLGTLQFFMKYIKQRSTMNLWGPMRENLKQIAKFETGTDFIGIFVSYTLTQMEKTDKIELTDFLNNNIGKDAGEKVMISVADEIFDDGFSKGKLEGKLEGKYEVVLGLLKSKAPIELIADVTGFSPEEIRKIKGN